MSPSHLALQRLETRTGNTLITGRLADQEEQWRRDWEKSLWKMSNVHQMCQRMSKHSNKREFMDVIRGYCTSSICVSKSDKRNSLHTFFCHFNYLLRGRANFTELIRLICQPFYEIKPDIALLALLLIADSRDNFIIRWRKKWIKYGINATNI